MGPRGPEGPPAIYYPENEVEMTPEEIMLQQIDYILENATFVKDIYMISEVIGGTRPAEDAIPERPGKRPRPDFAPGLPAPPISQPPISEGPPPALPGPEAPPPPPPPNPEGPVFSETQKKILTIIRKYYEAQRSIPILQKKITQLQNQIEELKKGVGNGDRITSLTEKVKSLKDRVVQYERTMSKVQKQIQNYRKKNPDAVKVVEDYLGQTVPPP